MEGSKRVFCSSSLLFCILFIITLPLAYFAFFQIDQWKPYLKNWDLNLSSGEKETLEFLLRKLVRGKQREQLEKTGFTFLSELHSDLYITSKEVRFDANSSKLYIQSNQELQKYQVFPYVLKDYAADITELITPVEIQLGNSIPQQPSCDQIHDVPAVIFSAGGFTGNMYHDVNDVIIPLFITSRHFRSEVKFVVTDFHLWFIEKYKNVFRKLSRYEVINAAKETANGTVHCFPGAILGLKSHGFLSFNKSDTPGGYSMPEFRDFLEKSYNFTTKDVSELIGSQKPRLLLLSRTKTRTLLNQDEVVKTMEDLGFEVVISTMKMMLNFEVFIRIINSCSVMVGVHGAGLTNELFLPNGAVTIQVVPIALEGVGNAYFGAPAEGMGLRYLEYRIEAQESSLFEMYGPDHPVITNPKSIEEQGGYSAYRDIFLIKQNVKINVQRFRKTLVQAMRLLGR